MSFYAVANGRNNGIFMSWNECSQSVTGYKNAIYKKFNTLEQAEEYIQLNRPPDTSTSVTSKIKEVSEEPDYYVYTDGACSNNGKDNALAGMGIFFGINDIRNLSQKLDGKQSNNAAELSAIICAYSIIANDVLYGKKITIVTDSEYSIKCLTTYGEKCCKQNWTKDIPNKELVKQAFELYQDKPNVTFLHIKAHTDNTDIHSFGNYHADKLANMAIGLDNCPYDKPVKKYVPFPDKDDLERLGYITSTGPR
jgi:ribonuclease HI